MILRAKTLKSKIVLLVVIIVTVVPAILVALIASVYYYLGIQKLFSETIEEALFETVKVAELYLVEHKDSIKADILAVGSDLERNMLIIGQNPEILEQFLNQQAYLRDLLEIVVFNKRTIIGYSYFSFPAMFETFSADIIAKADDGNVAILEDVPEDRVRALVKINGMQDTYLLVGRYIDQNILNHMGKTQGSVNQYKDLRGRVHTTQIQLILAFVGLAALLCCNAIIVALKFAHKITQPVSELVTATSRISAGDFSARVPQRGEYEEISTLGAAFNSMIERIAKQTKKLQSANKISEERKKFIEMVLMEISTSVIVLDISGKVTLCNEAGYKLLQVDSAQLISRPLENFIPQIADLLEKVKNTEEQFLSQDLKLEQDEKMLYLYIRIGVQKNTENIVTNYVITLDDTSSIVQAQKAAAWSDVARRIAHEIKNPLTPIQLSVEQLERKFKPKEKMQLELFHKYIATIINHVSDIGAIIENYVKFANIPSPKFQKVNIITIIEEVILLHKNAFPAVNFIFENEITSCYVFCDKTQISQVIINLTKNSIEAIESNLAKKEGEVRFYCLADKKEGSVTVKIIDNGGGIMIPLDRILEPYVTTKQKGTGLGLAIVKKIIEDHGSHIAIANAEAGASVSFKLPLFNNTKEINNVV